MDVTEQEKLVGDANIIGVTMQKLTDKNRELEAINDTLRDALSRADEEIARKDAIIANITIQRDEVMRDSDLTHAALLDINARCRETLGRKFQPPAQKPQQQLTGSPARPLPPERPIPSIVRQGPAVG